MIPHQFGRAPAGTLGIEEELILVDAETFKTAPTFTKVIGDGHPGLKPELFECFVEVVTPVVADPGDVLAELQRLRSEVAALAEPHGILLHAAGSHALASGIGQPIVPVRRYQVMAGQLGWRIFQQLVCGLHVHVSVPDPETALDAFETLVPWLPLLLGLSANSPFAGGKSTGRRSERAERLLKMPTGGTPPVLATWDDWTAANRGDSTRRHWDAWPRPEYGTVEVRVMDMQTDVRRSAGFAAVVQALVTRPVPPRAEPYDRELYGHRRAKAAVEPPDPAEVEALAAIVEPRLTGQALALAQLVLNGRPEAERQLEVAAGEGIPAVPRDVVARTLDG